MLTHLLSQLASCSTWMAPWLVAASRIWESGCQQTELTNWRFWLRVWAAEAAPESEDTGTGGDSMRRAIGLDMAR